MAYDIVDAYVDIQNIYGVLAKHKLIDVKPKKDLVPEEEEPEELEEEEQIPVKRRTRRPEI